ncbi:MAG TPA: ABC transporter permease [Puia sp.]|nr:ABC transporter permease [Puia sp.]
MIKNYLRIAFRNLWKHRVYSSLNILGLTIGMTACFLIFLYVRFELSYDNFHSKKDRIYRMVCDIKTPTEVLNLGICSAPMAINAKDEFPDIEKVVRFDANSFLLRKGEIKFQEDKAVMADSAFFEVFDFPLLHGDPHTALSEPFSIVLSETTAKKYFSNTNPMGQTLLMTDASLPVKVTGVMKDMPENTLLKADLLVSKSTSKRQDSAEDRRWGSFGMYSYLLLKPNVNAKALEKKFPAFLEKRDGKEMKQQQMFFSLFLEPLTDVYLKTGKRGAPETGNMANVYIFSIVGAFILLIACINFINLTTARSTERAKEVGIRKVVGAERGQLTNQFLGESILQALIAFVLAVVACALLIPQFNFLAGKIVSTGLFYHPSYILSLLAIAVGIGLLAGIYPALILSSFQPIVVLKGRFATGTRGLILRRGLVVFQFTISIAFIASTLIVHSQLSYMRNQDLGFSNQQMLVLNTHGDNHRKALREEIARLPGVLSTAMSSSVPGGGNPGAYSQVQNVKGDMQIANLDLYFVDFDYLKQYKMKIIAGRAFSRDYGTDTTKAMILNESAVKLFGYHSPQDAIGRKFSQWGREGQIIGVVKDFHFRSLQSEIKPLSIRIEPDGCDLISANVRMSDLKTTIASIENKWKTVIPYRPFSYYFADEFFDRQYRTEDRFGKLFLNFAILAIFISCLGLLGLASYSTLQRTKEIGIRKVLGASVPGIVNLLSKEFLQLVLIAFLIATPISWYFMDKWLKDFHYRIDIQWWIFILAGILAFVVSLVTISFQAIRAALTNPVESLRAE